MEFSLVLFVKKFRWIIGYFQPQQQQKS